MLWSLIKIVLFLCALAALAFGAATLMDLEGGILLEFAGQEYSFSLIQAVLALLVLMLLVLLTLKLIAFSIALFKFAIGDETALSRYFDRNKERRGYQALADGMVALASGEGREALHKAARAEKLLGKPELTNLLAAQAAEMTGDRRKAEAIYKDLITHDATRFVGVRGIMKQRLSDGDTDTALKLAEKAFALKPAHSETQDILLQLQAENADWSGARKTLAAKRSNGDLPPDVHRRRDAVLALSQAKSLIEADDIVAQEESIEANRKSPDLIPAAAMAARTYIAQNKPRYATRVLKKAWEGQPHPDLAAAFAEIAPRESAKDRIKRFETLTKINPEHPETQMLVAELNIAAEDFPAARRAMGALATDDPTARSLAIMAAIERGEGADDTKVRGWLTRALSASRGPQWVCDNCNVVHGAWAPICNNCNGFDTLAWRTPSEGEIGGTAAMLPLIVGTPPAPVVPTDGPIEAEILPMDPDRKASA